MISESKKNKVNKPTKVQADRFLHAVGWFVTIFSIVERHVHEALWHFTKVDPIIARCIFSGTRMDAAIGQLKRIAEATKWPKEHKALLDHIALQLGEITQLRNDLLHFGVTENDVKDLVVTNKMYAHVASRIRATKLSAAVLKRVTDDLWIILLQLRFLISGGDRLARAVRDALGGKYRMVPLKRFRPALHEGFTGVPWGYKPKQEGRQAASKVRRRSV